MLLRDAADEFRAQALGQSHRPDPVLKGTGGPAGNARLTAWVGLLLLVLFVAELVTLLDVRGLVSWHIVIGVLLIPPALVKTGSTIWRFARYYTGNQPYRTAGPPPLLLRIIGPFVVLSTLGVLASGVAVIVAGPTTARQNIAGSFELSLLNIHKAFFAVWCVATGVHVLGRLVLALRLTVVPGLARMVPGRVGRTVTLAATAVVAVVASVVTLSVMAPWNDPVPFGRDRPEHVRPR